MTDLPHPFDMNISITFMLWTNSMLLYFCLPIQASKEHLEKHYADLSSKPFFPGLVEYMSSGPVVPMVGIRAVVDALSRQCRDNRDFRDCRHTIFAVSTEFQMSNVQTVPKNP